MLSTVLVVVYKKLEGNINQISITDAWARTAPKAVKVSGPKEPLNVLVHGLGQP